MRRRPRTVVEHRWRSIEVASSSSDRLRGRRGSVFEFAHFRANRLVRCQNGASGCGSFFASEATVDGAFEALGDSVGGEAIALRSPARAFANPLKKAVCELHRRRLRTRAPMPATFRWRRHDAGGGDASAVRPEKK
ncbi:MAG TPA: hypothetical protein VGD42_15710 [Lysobacter sp.]